MMITRYPLGVMGSVLDKQKWAAGRECGCDVLHGDDGMVRSAKLSCPLALMWPQEPVPHGWILNPDSNTRISWDLGSLIMVLYDMVMIPMQAYDARQKTKGNAGNVYESS